MNNDYLDYLAHYRTPGAVNGVSHTPGYDAVGKPAMSEAERRARAKELRKKSISDANNVVDTFNGITNRYLNKAINTRDKYKGSNARKRAKLDSKVNKLKSVIDDNESFRKFVVDRYKNMTIDELNSSREYVSKHPNSGGVKGSDSAFNYTQMVNEYQRHKKGG